MTRVLLLGNSPLATHIAEVARVHAQVAIAGVLGEAPYPGITSAGEPDDLDRAMENLDPEDAIVVALQDPGSIERVLQHRLDGREVINGAEFLERMTCRVAIEEANPTDLIRAAFRRARFHTAFSRVFSAVLAAAGLLILAPLLLLIAVAVRLDSAGPSLFVQERIGLGGRPFNLLKFRSMACSSGPTSEWERDNLHRITRVGAWLRRLRLDELPQLVNVLRGEMNLVGPRPHPVTNAALFQARIPWYTVRNLVRPGITGWAQVRLGYANGLIEETEKVRYDIWYVKNRSTLLDLAILAQTLPAVFRQRLGNHSAPSAERRPL